MGTPEFSVTALDALVEAGHEVICAYSQPPRPAGRGKKPRPSPVQQRAEVLGIPVRHPSTLKTPDARAEFAALDADVAVVVAYGLILPQAVLDAPSHGCLNIHASLLPRWRGAAPIHRAVMAGDVETGVCIMQMDAGLDTGPVLMRAATPIGASDTTGDLHDRLAVMGGELIVETLARLDALEAEAQPDTGVTYASKIDKAEARVDWTRPAAEVDQLIRGPFAVSRSVVRYRRRTSETLTIDRERMVRVRRGHTWGASRSPVEMAQCKFYKHSDPESGRCPWPRCCAD